MLTCREMTELVTDYMEGRLPLRQRFRFQMHVGLCGHCRTYLRQTKRAVRLLADLPPEPMPPDVERDLLARFRDWKS